jgi:hypothetical protein
LTHKEIAKELKITRQAVSKLVRRGMPTSSAEAAQFWRQRNTRRLHYTPTPLPRYQPPALPAPVALETLSVDDGSLEALNADGSVIDLRAWDELTSEERINVAVADILDGELDNPDGEVPSMEHAIAFAKLCNEVLRQRIRRMPAAVAAAANPENPSQAQTALEDWLAAFEAEMFTQDYSSALRWTEAEQPSNHAT